MSLSPLIVIPVLALLLAACASSDVAEPPAAPSPVLEEVPDTVRASVEREPEIPLAQRIRAPFAVQSSGRLAPREPRVGAVVLDSSTARRRTTEAAAAAQGDTIPTRADTTAVARTAVSDASRRSAPAAHGSPPARPSSAAPAAPAARQPTSPSPRPRDHRVGAGETFLSIARRYEVTYTQLLNANPGVDPDRLRPNQLLRIPAAAAPPAAAGRTTTPPATPSPSRPSARTHTVAAGETLWSIARRYNVTPEQIRTANRLPNDIVRPGQRLVIP